MTGKETFKSTRTQRSEGEDGSGGKTNQQKPAGGVGVKVHSPSLPPPT